MAIRPVARYMLLCEGWRYEDRERRRLTVVGLLATPRPGKGQTFPFRHDEFCVVLGLSGGRGRATCQLFGVIEETGKRVFGIPPQEIEFGPDPLDVFGVTFRVQGAVFHEPGSYLIQFWYDGEMVEECTLMVR